MSYSPADPGPVSILIAPSAIGTLSAEDAAQQLGEGVNSIIRDADIRLAPINPDFSQLFGGETVSLPTTTASGNLTEATYVLDKQQATAYIDAARVTGTQPMEPGTSDSYGIGVLVADAQSRGARRVVLSLAACPVDDGGVGVLVALGVNPLDQPGHTLPKGGAALETLADFDTAQVNVGAGAVQWVLVTDNSDPLDTALPGLARLAQVTGVDPTTPGLGAGGSVAVGITWLSALLHGTADNVRLLSTSELLADALDTSELLAAGTFVVTAGDAAGAFARSAADTNVLGVVLKQGQQSPQSPAETLCVSSADDLRGAGAQLAADYLRISTVQG